MNQLISEDDIRTKVVMSWLLDHGISTADIRIEFAFTVRLGRTTIAVGDRPYRTPRADVLVRRSDGRNLLIVEVKAPGEPLDDEVRDQGISYARGITTGNMPPFVVLTNGAECRIIDTLTKGDIQGTRIPIDHPHVAAGYRISGDDIALRAEALELLVSLSPENLLQFCKDQCAHHMGRLRSDDLYSGKKYLPKVYVDRATSNEELARLLNEQNRVILVIGQPQVGKTNFICHQVESRLASGQPCLFFPAIGMRGSLFAEIAEDFGHLLGDTRATPFEVLAKLRRIVARWDKPLLLFVDGWNEATAEIARAIDSDASRLSSHPLQLVVSLTNTAATRLLLDDAGNPSYLAEAASIPPPGARLIESKPISDVAALPWSVVHIEGYSNVERDRAYAIYAQHYQVEVPATHQRTSEPYLLGLAMEQFGNGALPATLDEPSLIRESLQRKAARVRSLTPTAVETMLIQLASSMARTGAPLPIQNALDTWRLSSSAGVPTGLYDAALLAECVDENQSRCVDFYYGRERNYAVACWALGWLTCLRSAAELMAATEPVLQTDVGVDALRWFFRQPQYISQLEQHCDGLPRLPNSKAQSLLLSGLCEIILNGHMPSSTRLFSNNRGDAGIRRDEPDARWLRYAVSLIEASADVDVRVAAVRLATIAAEPEGDLLLDALTRSKSLKEAVIAILTIGDEHPLAVGSLGEVVLEAFRSLHLNSLEDMHSGLGHSEISSVLSDLLSTTNRDMRRYAADSLGDIAPLVFFQEAAALIKTIKGAQLAECIDDFLGGVKNAEATLGERYHGSLCSGVLEWIEGNEEAKRAEFEEVHPVIAPIIATFPESATGFLRGLIEDLRPLNSESTDRVVPSPNNRLFPFMDSD
jgi:hypothetical protein